MGFKENIKEWMLVAFLVGGGITMPDAIAKVFVIFMSSVLIGIIVWEIFKKLKGGKNVRKLKKNTSRKD